MLVNNYRSIQANQVVQLNTIIKQMAVQQLVSEQELLRPMKYLSAQMAAQEVISLVQGLGQLQNQFLDHD